MRFIRIFFIISLLLPACLYASTDSVSTQRYEISLLTCGTGEELYSSFGHTGIRVKDRTMGTDEVYNYGTFNFKEPGFNIKFTRGKLLYWVSKERFSDFILVYQDEGRFVKEQILAVTDSNALALVRYLEDNCREQNKYYKYDFIYDNCATRVRDAFPDAWGVQFGYGEVLRSKKVSFRQVINQYLIDKHWSRFGINLLLGAKVDSTMNDYYSMFLPDFLHQGIQGAMLDGREIVKEEKELLAARPTASSGTFNGPFWLTIALLTLTLLSYHFPAFRFLKPVVNFLVLFVTGLLGCLMLFMWLGTDHQACRQNWNILWALPPNLIIAFIKHKSRIWYKIYALGAISVLLAVLIIHVIGIQAIPLVELIPLFGCLLYVYMDMYKQALSAIIRRMAPAAGKV